MNKGNKLSKIGKGKAQRKALLRSLSNDLIMHERILTTEAKAKALRPFVERMITHGTKETVASRRHVQRFLSKPATNKLMHEVAPMYKGRNGGYTRIIKAPKRESDLAKMAIIELVK